MKYTVIFPFMSACRRIRNIAVRSTAPWTTISIGRARHKRGKPYSRLNWRQLCLDRAGVNLLEIIIVLSYARGHYDEIVELALRTRTLHLERPEGMWLEGEVQTIYQAILLLLRPMLRQLRLHADWVPARTDEAQILIASSGVLTSLDLDVVNGANESGVLPPLKQLRKLPIGQWYHGPGASLELPQLEDVHVYYSYLDEGRQVYNCLMPVLPKSRIKTRLILVRSNSAMANDRPHHESVTATGRTMSRTDRGID